MATQDLSLVLAYLPDKYRKAYAQGKLTDDDLLSWGKQAGLIKEPKADFSNVTGTADTVPALPDRYSNLPYYVGRGLTALDSVEGLGRDVAESIKGGAKRSVGAAEYTAADNNSALAPVIQNLRDTFDFQNGGSIGAVLKTMADPSRISNERIAQEGGDLFNEGTQQVGVAEDSARHRVTGDTVGKVATGIGANPATLLGVGGGPMSVVPSGDFFNQEYTNARLKGLSHDDAMKEAGMKAGAMEAIAAIPAGSIFGRIPAVRKLVEEPIMHDAAKFLVRTGNNMAGEAVKMTGITGSGLAVDKANESSDNEAVAKYANSNLPDNLLSLFDTLKDSAITGAVMAGVTSPTEMFKISAEKGKLASDMFHGQVDSEKDIIREQNKLADQRRSNAIGTRGTVDDLFGTPDNLPTHEQYEASKQNAYEELAKQQILRQQQEAGAYDQNNRRKALDILTSDAASRGNIMADALQRAGTGDLARLPRAPEEAPAPQPEPVQQELGLNEPLQPADSKVLKDQLARKRQVDEAQGLLNEDDTVIQNKAKSARAAERRRYAALLVNHSRDVTDPDARANYVADGMAKWDEEHPLETFAQTERNKRMKINTKKDAPLPTREETPVAPGEEDNSPIRPEENLQGVDALRRAAGLSQETDVHDTGVRTEHVFDTIMGGLHRGDAKAIAKHIADKNLVIVDDASAIPSNAQMQGTGGYYDGKRTYVVANQLRRGNIMGDLLNISAHEIKHAADFAAGPKARASLANLIGDGANKRLNAKIEALAEAGDPKAKAAVEAAKQGSDPDTYHLELPAYFINAARAERDAKGPVGQLRDNIVAAVRSAAKRKFGDKADVNLKDVAYLSDKLLKDTAREGKRLETDKLSTDGMKMYVGEKANLDPHEIKALENAKKLEDKGVPNEMIRQYTGWFKNPHDDQWRMEISDKGAKFKIPFEDLPESTNFGEKNPLKYGDVLEHPELFKKYPELKDMEFNKQAAFLDIMKQYQGWYNEEKNVQAVTPYAQDPLSTSLHETQHAIQGRENFARGGNAEEVWNHMNEEQIKRVAEAAHKELVEKRADAAGKMAALAKVESWPKHDEYLQIEDDLKNGGLTGRDWLDAYQEKQALLDDLRKHLSVDKNWYPSAMDGTMQFLDRGETKFLDESKEKVRKEILDLNGKIHDIQTGGLAGIKKATKNSKVAFDQYRAIAGEIEARDTQARRNLTDEERKDTQPYTSEKFNPEDVIITRGTSSDEAASQEPIDFQKAKEKKETVKFRDKLMGDVRSRAEEMMKEAEEDGRHRFKPGDEAVLEQSGRRIRILAKMLMTASDKTAREQFGEKQYEQLSYNEKLKLKKLLRKEPGYMAETTDFRSDEKGRPLDDQPEGAYRTMIYDWGIRDPEKNKFGVIDGGKGLGFNVKAFQEGMKNVKLPDNKALRILRAQADFTGGLGRELNEMREDSVGYAALGAHRAMNSFGRINGSVTTMAKEGVKLGKFKDLEAGEAHFKKEINDNLERIAAIPDADRREAAMAAWVRDNPHMRPVFDAVNEVNRLSKNILAQQLMTHPDPTPAQLRDMNTIANNYFRYTTRMYAAFQGEAGREHSRLMVKQWEAGVKALAKKGAIPEKLRANFETYNNALKYLIDHDLRIPDREGMESLSTERLSQLYDTWVGNATETRQRARGMATDEGLNKTGADAAVRETMIDALEKRAKYVNDADLQGKAQDIAKGMLGLHESGGPFAHYYRGFAQDRTILQHREHLPEEIRSLFGEIKDPATRLAVTIAKQSELVGRTKLLLDMRDMGEGKWVIPPEKAGLPGNEKFTSTLAGKNYGPLNGWRTEPRIAEAIGSQLEIYSTLTEALAKSYTNTEAALAALGRTASKGITSLAAKQKLMSVVFDLYNIGNNFAGSFVGGLSNGVINPKHYLDGLRVGAEVVADTARGGQAKRSSQDYDDAIRYGILDSARVQEIRATPQEVIRQMISDETKAYRNAKSGLVRAKRTVVEGFAMSDAWTKITAWKDRVDTLKKYYEAEGIKKSDEEIKREAADTIKDTSITYSRVPPVVRNFEAAGLTTFMPYFYSVPRLIVNNYVRGFKDLILAHHATTPKAKAIMLSSAMRRIAGNTASTFGFVALTKGIAAWVNGDDKDKAEQMKKLMQDDARFSDSIYLGKDAAGVPLFFRLSKTDAFGPVNDLLRVALDDELTPEEKSRHALETFKGLFFTNRIAATAFKALAGTFTDTDIRDKKTKLERIAPNTMEHVKDAITSIPGASLTTANLAIEVLDALTPGLLNSFDPKNKEPTEIKNNDPWMRFLSDMTLATGGRLDRADPNTAAFLAVQNVKKARDEGRKRMADGFAAGSDPKDLLRRYMDAANNEYLGMQKANDAAEGMLNGLDMTPRQMSQVFKDAGGSQGGLTAADIAGLRTGKLNQEAEDWIKQNSAILSEGSLQKRTQDSSMSKEEQQQQKKNVKEFLKMMKAMGLHVRGN